jgi:hypothetical protein
VIVVGLQEFMADIVTATLFIMKCGISHFLQYYGVYNIQMFPFIKEFEEALSADRTLNM